jgi:maltose alpha-D-glucosyltransferase/alpha-amylase
MTEGRRRVTIENVKPEIDCGAFPIKRVIRYAGGIFMRAYLTAAGDAPFLPKEKGDIDMLIQIFPLENAGYEIGYELNNRPDWVIIP